ncbi:DNA cytosine methyltransferase [Rhizobium leguminosarum]|uniref:DNA cytosine methyltransferase n=1 Tax=Rhizobium leguminosarum TaxID=384 RepID=UPI000482C7CA|nr:DNA cytosine methyltransferase [Rhizobium leguminosarum]WFT84362.1 DNA cytosine methyltransferase [Rhizobium leguminosarum]
MFLIAGFDPTIDAGDVLFERDGQGWHPSTSRPTQEEAAGSRPRSAGELIWPPILGTLNASGAGMSRPAGQGNELDFVIIFDDGTVRPPTPMECERAQGFQDGWTDVELNGRAALDIERYRGIGNSMWVPVMEFIGYRLRRAVAMAEQERIAA